MEDGERAYLEAGTWGVGENSRRMTELKFLFKYNRDRDIK